MFLIFGLFGFINVFGQSKLTTEITNLRNDKGLVSLELLDKDNQNYQSKKLRISNGKIILQIDNIKDGKYAIRYIHDENSNDKLDTNWLGIPNEGYGFSNNAYGSFGLKDFEEWIFTVKGNTKNTMTTKYQALWLTRGHKTLRG